MEFTSQQIEPLTKRSQREKRYVLLLSALGFTINAIATILGRTPSSISRQRESIRQLFGGQYNLLAIGAELAFGQSAVITFDELNRAFDNEPLVKESLVNLVQAAGAIDALSVREHQRLKAALIKGCSEYSANPGKATETFHASLSMFSFPIILLAAASRRLITAEEMSGLAVRNGSSYYLKGGVRVTISAPAGQQVIVEHANDIITIRVS